MKPNQYKHTIAKTTNTFLQDGKKHLLVEITETKENINCIIITVTLKVTRVIITVMTKAVTEQLLQ